MCRFCGRHISSRTHPCGMFVALICFRALRRMRLTGLQRSGLLLQCRTECLNIAKFDYEKFNHFFDFFWMCGFCGRHISSTVTNSNSKPDRCNPVKRILRKALKQIKPTNTPNECVVEEICLPKNPRNQKSVKFCNVVALSSGT